MEDRSSSLKLEVWRVALAIAAMACAGPSFAEMDHMTGYKVKEAVPSPLSGHTVQNPYGSGTCTLKKAKYYLTGAEKDGGDDPRGGPAGDYICYTAKCDLPGFLAPLKVDQLGAHNVAASKLKIVCLPAISNGCGDGNVDGGEQCDGSADLACPGQCQPDCTCPAVPVCGDGIVNGGEACDGADDSACPEQCNSDCTCQEGTVCVGGGGYPTCGGSCPVGQECSAVSYEVVGIGPIQACGCYDSGTACPAGQALDGSTGAWQCLSVPTCNDNYFNYPACSGSVPTGSLCQAFRYDGFFDVGLFCSSISASASCSGGSGGVCPAGQACTLGGSGWGCRDVSSPACGSTEGASCGSCGSGLCFVEGGSTHEYSGPGSVCGTLSGCTFAPCTTDADCPSGKACGSYAGSFSTCCDICP